MLLLAVDENQYFQFLLGSQLHRSHWTLWTCSCSDSGSEHCQFDCCHSKLISGLYLPPIVFVWSLELMLFAWKALNNSFLFVEVHFLNYPGFALFHHHLYSKGFAEKHYLRQVSFFSTSVLYSTKVFSTFSPTSLPLKFDTILWTMNYTTYSDQSELLHFSNLWLDEECQSVSARDGMESGKTKISYARWFWWEVNTPSLF